MTRWECIDETLRVYRADYRVGNGGEATCCAFGLEDKRLLLLSPPGERDADLLDELDQIGEVHAIVAPNGFHRIGIPVAQARYPQASIFVEPRAQKRVSAVCKPSTLIQPISALQAILPTHLEIFVPPAMKNPDTIVRIDSSQGYIWYINDIITNIPSLPKQLLLRTLLKTLGFRAGLSVNRFGCRFILLKDRAAFSRWLQQELAQYPPAILIAGHGPTIRDAALPQILQDLLKRDLP